MWLDQKLYKAVGDALAAARAHAGVKQVDLAKRLRKPQSFISSYESGQRRVDVLELVRICEELGADPRRVFGDILARQQRLRRK